MTANRYNDHCAEYPAVNFVVPVSGKIIDLKNGEITGDQQFDGGPGHGKICTCLCG